MIFVDQESFQSYNGMGLGKLFDNQEKTKLGAKNIKMPVWSFDQWKTYIIAVKYVAPNGKNVIEGVSKLGATYGINGKNIIYIYEEGVPGDNPDINQIVSLLKSSK